MGADEVKRVHQVQPVSAADSVEKEPMVNTTSWLYDARWRVEYVKVDVAKEYNQKIRRMISKLKTRGIDIERYGAVRVDGYVNQLFLSGISTGVDSTNTISVGTTGWMEDWQVELSLVHEFRHLVQNHEVWNRLAREKGLDPEVWPLARLTREGKVPKSFAPVWGKYYDWYYQENRELLAFDELDAYLFEYDYSLEMLERRELDEGQWHGFLISTFYRLGDYLAEAKKLPPDIWERKENQVIAEKAQQRLASLWRLLVLFNSNPYRDKVLQSIDVQFKRLFRERSSYLRYPSGRPFSLRERLISLQAADAHLSIMHASAQGLTSSPQAIPIMDSIENFHDRVHQLLNRQTVRYQLQLSKERLPHQLRYGNDTWHLSDGSLRAQHLAEVDFDVAGNAAARAGQDFGVYLPVPHVANLYLKGAPLVYAGTQTDRDDFHLGARLDLGLQYDLDWTQRFGTSLFVGYSLGGEWGTQRGEAYHLLGAGLEAFRF